MLSNDSNIVVVCSHSNGMFESSERASKAAQRYGWKLRAGETSEWAPVYDAYAGVWYVLDNDYGRIQTTENEETPPR